MNATHTPGPWNYGMSADDPPHFYFHVGPQRMLEWHLERMHASCIPPTEADARLMAAAPELLDACKAMARYLEEIESDLLELKNLYGPGRAAIAKAEGAQ